MQNITKEKIMLGVLLQLPMIKPPSLTPMEKALPTVILLLIGAGIGLSMKKLFGSSSTNNSLFLLGILLILGAIVDALALVILWFSL